MVSGFLILPNNQRERSKNLKQFQKVSPILLLDAGRTGWRKAVGEIGKNREENKEGQPGLPGKEIYF